MKNIEKRIERVEQRQHRERERGPVFRLSKPDGTVIEVGIQALNGALLALGLSREEANERDGIGQKPTE